MPGWTFTRRGLLAAAATCTVRAQSSWRIATFSADVTPPIGEPLLAGVYEPALRIEDPLYAKGFVLLGPDPPVVVVAVDFCEIRTATYQHWKQTIAGAAGTTPERVFVTSLHQHDAPLGDEAAQRIIEEHNITKGRICNVGFHHVCARKTADAVRAALRAAKRITHYGIGQAKVERVASNRRAELPGGAVVFRRNSFTPDLTVRNAPEGLVDPFLKTLSFWADDRPVAALSCYSVHAQTHFGKGGVTSDFTGLARSRRQQDTPDMFQLYAAGCSGDTTVGKYNGGAPGSIPVLAGRLRDAMDAAFRATERHSLRSVKYRSAPLPLRIHDRGSNAEAAQKQVLADGSQPFNKQVQAALGLAWRRQAAQGYRIRLPAFDFGGAVLILAPGETFVQYQLWAQQMRLDQFVMTLGYGECAPGYIPTRKALADGWKDESWSWADPESSEEILLGAFRSVLQG